MKIKLPIYTYSKCDLSYKQISLTPKKIFYFLFYQVLFSLIIITILTIFFNTPKEIKLKKEITQLEHEFYLIDNKANDIINLLNIIETKDSVIYNSLFNDNINDTLINKFKSGYLSNYSGSFYDTIINIGDKLTTIERSLENKNYKFRKLIINISHNNNRLKHIPAIQPLSNNDLRRTSSGFGYRIHPIYHVRKLHKGMDFVAPEGTPIYATGDGIVEISSKSYYGYGKYIKINHGYGYETAYAHLSELKVKRGQRVKRGEVIGLLGNTGLSTGPHLHYEVHVNGQYVDPINYYFHDLTAQQYEEMRTISLGVVKSLD
ncbi:MAG: M23 family metallopeptidase [bacterium]